MKNGLLIWNVVLTLIVAYLLVTHFTGKTEGKVVSKTASSTGTAAAPGTFRIAYFEQDSVESSYNMIKEVVSDMEKKEGELNNSLAGLQSTFNKKRQELESRGNMSPAEIENANAELNQLGNRLAARKQELEMEYQSYATTRNIAVKKNVLDFLEKYNKDKNYTYIISTNESGVFYYKDSAYNITADIVAGLNEEYSKKQKEKSK